IEIVEVKSIATAFVALLFLAVYNKSLLKVKAKDLWCFGGTGILSLLLFNFFYFEAITLTSMSIAVSLLYTAPVFVMIFSVFLFKEAVTKRKVIAIASSFLGCILVSGALMGTSQLTALGFIFGIGAGLCYALYSVFSRFALNKGYHPFTITAYTFVFTSIGGAFFTDFSIVEQVYLQHKSEVFLNYFVLSVVITFIPYILYTIGLVYIENSKAAVMVSVEPAIATLLGFLIFSEIPSFLNFIGMILIISAVVILNIRRFKRLDLIS
ncbi:MAG: EamA family transporter, partial [Peptostreptococcaceae bacterium]|nr:EamA family transporter [Peptostreptococcaceae bacterium]